MKTTNPQTSGRGWAYTGMILGGLVSVAANVAHSFVPPKNAPANWSPDLGAVVEAVVWPVFLFIAIEILARVDWPAGKWWRRLRYGGMLPVALVAAFVSYEHLSALLTHYQEQGIVTIFGPLAVDGLMVMATGAVLATSAHRRPAPTPPASNEAKGDAASTNTSWQTSTHSDPEPVTVTPVPVASVEPVTVPAHLLPTARFVVTNYESSTGQAISPEELSVRMSVDQDTAARILATVDPTRHTPAPRVNGTHPNVAAIGGAR